jgi:hypothetical protein
MYIQAQREAGKYAIETFCELAPINRPNTYGGFETVACAVAYSDKGLPSHSVRLFQPREE